MASICYIELQVETCIVLILKHWHFGTEIYGKTATKTKQSRIEEIKNLVSVNYGKSTRTMPYANNVKCVIVMKGERYAKHSCELAG